MDVTIKEVSSKKDLKLFVRFPHTLYRDNPYWVPGLLSDDEALFDPKKNPAFETCRAKLWLACKNGKVVGRVAGVINETYLKKWGNRYARFGWLDFVDDEQVARALLQQVERWAKENNMTAVHGPMGFTDFDSEGLLTDGFDQPGTMSTIYNYAYYATYLEKIGYKKDVDWIEYEVKIPSSTPERVRKFSELAAQRYGLRVLKVKKARELLPYAKDVFGLINVAYSHLYSVVPLSKKQVDTYTSQYFGFIRHDFVSFILQGDTLVAFAIAMPSLSDALRKARGRLLPFGIFHLYRALQKNDVADLFLIAVRPDLQNKAVTSMLMHDLCEKMIRNKVVKAITHPMLEENGNVLNIWKNFEKTVVRKRRCYLRHIEDPIGLR
ncbi:MAG TPA: GNAT family N-acetyltransferase [Cyclobacteriaceae bacterium]|nr:GNAT family N-acetyltransferase [Cyclobacteriaceae bacterium]